MVISMLEALLGILSSGGMGALVGLLGSVATKWLEYKTAGQRLVFEKEMAQIRTRELELEQQHALALADKQIDIARVEGEIQADVASMAAFVESQKEHAATYGGFVDQLRGVMRPLITSFLLGVSTWLMWSVWKRVDGLSSLSDTELLSLFHTLLDSVTFLTMTAVTWWFGSRWSQENKSPK